MDEVVMQLADKAFKSVKTYTSGGQTLEQAQAQWQELQGMLGKLGYKAVILSPNAPDEVCVSVVKATVSAVAFLFSAQAFCHLCEQASVKVCCNLHWCGSCYESHRLQEHYDRRLP